MRIKCKNCGYFADGVDVSSHLGSCLIKAFGTAAVNYFMKLIMDSVTNQTRSFYDDSLALVANVSEMKCSKCEKTVMWKPFPIMEKKETKKEKVINEL